MCALLLVASPARPAGFRLERDAWGSAGGITSSPTLRVGLTLSQPVSGRSVAPGFLLLEGFWHGTAVPVVAVPPAIPPGSFALELVGQNPFRAGTSVRFAIARGPAPSRVDIAVFDVTGRMVRQLERRAREPGVYIAHWDGRNQHGTPLGSGVYFVRMEAGTFHSTRRLVLIR